MKFLKHKILFCKVPRFVMVGLLLTQAVLLYSIEVDVDLLNIDKGLPQSNVIALHLDTHGFLWVGTQDGLSRYDGYSFQTYQNNPVNETTISNNFILSIDEDLDGNLWVGTWRGLSVFNPKTNCFKNFFHSDSDTTSLSDNRAFEVFVDKENRVWVKTLEALNLYNPDSESFLRFPHYADSLTSYSDVSDFDMFEDRNNNLWVGTKDGLLLFDRNSETFERYAHNQHSNNTLSSNRVTSIIEDQSGNLWVGTANGLNRYSPDDQSFSRFLYNPQKPFGINYLFIDDDGRFLVGNDIGLHEFNPRAKTIKPIVLNFEGKELQAPRLNHILKDESGILWVGTHIGLVKWDQKRKKFKEYSKNRHGENLFSNNMVSSVFVQDSLNIWVGTWGSGLHLYNRQTGKVVKYSTNLGYPYTICNDYVHVIKEISKGRLIIGTRDGVQILNKKTGAFSDFFNYYGVDSKQLFKNIRIYGFEEDNEGNLWIASRLGLHQFDYIDISSYYHVPNDTTSLSSSEIHCIELDSEFLWVGTFDGLNRINLKTNTITRFKRKENYVDGGLASNDIVSLKIDSNDNLWIGTPSGLNIFHKKSNTFSLLTNADDLPNNLIYAIEEDINKNIWVSTNWGLAQIDKDDYRVTSYEVSDGLQSYEYNIGASYQTANGELFFGGISGLNSFHPDSLVINHRIPPIAITSIELVGTGILQHLSVVGRDEIVLRPNHSLVNIEFAALDFTAPQKNIFEYKMEGLEDEWITLGNRRMVTFSNLREGVYTFRVKGANTDNLWNNEGVRLRIIVKVKFWKSKVALGIYVIIFVVLLFVFLRVRTRILRRTSRLLKEREISMAEIEKQKEALFIQNKSITDSINYAKRIQEALMPSEEHFSNILPNSFILYMPKDIVSGDFYWINETESKIFVAAIDCTGHGVPGAFMSIIGVELLRNVTNVLGINDAAGILNMLDKGVHDTFSKDQTSSHPTVKDGMDVAFCVLDKHKNELQFAGAFSNLYIIRDSKIIEIKGDRNTVGAGGDLSKPLFSGHVISLQNDDMVYMFTDGYVDQFGGPEGKKFKFRRFRHLLLNIHRYPVEIQKKHLQGSINEWKGDNDQVDDILIVGIRHTLM